VNIRPERPHDFESIDAVVEAAFERPDEAQLVRRLRASDYYVPELALVAEEDGEILGHIMLSYADLEGATSKRILSLAPLAVRPAEQRSGIGIALTQAALHAADERDEPLVIVLGHPSYYPRFGFEPARTNGIEPPIPDLPDDVFMVRKLRSYDPEVRGTVRYPSAFDASS
jgi:putative acetyltransferase